MFIQSVDCLKIKYSNILFISPYFTSECKTEYCLISQKFYLILSPLQDSIQVYNLLTKEKDLFTYTELLGQYDLPSYSSIIILPFKSKQNLTAMQLLMDLSYNGSSQSLPFLKKEKIIKNNNDQLIFEKISIFPILKKKSDIIEISNDIADFAEFYKDRAIFFPIPGIDFSLINIPPSRIIDHAYLKTIYDFNSISSLSFITKSITQNLNISFIILSGFVALIIVTFFRKNKALHNF